jgi:hypothetical protein
MPSRRLPNSQVAVLRTLTSARDAWKQFPGDRIISATHWTKLDDGAPASFLSRLLKETGDIETALAGQAPATSALTEAVDSLALHVSHFHQVYDLGVARGVFTAAGRAHYGRDFTAESLPDLSTIPDILEAGAKIGPGELARQAADGPASHTPMALPDASEVAAIHANAVAKRAAAETAKLHTDTQQGEAAAMYPEAHALAVSILNTIEFNLSERPELDAAGRRRIARAWGAVYINDDGTVAEEPTPVPPAP